MALPSYGETREKQKFVEDTGGNVCVRTKSSTDAPPLPTGAATSAKQDDIISELQDIEAIVDPATDFEGAPVTVGTTAIELTFTETTQAILIQSDPDNTGKVWMGKSNVTNAGVNAMAQLEAGDALEMDLNDASNAVYAVSDTASQNVFKFALL